MNETLVLEPVRVPAWAWLAVAVALVALFALTMENGAVLKAGATLHEFFHDARHFAGVPCH